MYPREWPVTKASLYGCIKSRPSLRFDPRTIQPVVTVATVPTELPRPASYRCTVLMWDQYFCDTPFGTLKSKVYWWRVKPSRILSVTNIRNVRMPSCFLGGRLFPGAKRTECEAAPSSPLFALMTCSLLLYQSLKRTSGTRWQQNGGHGVMRCLMIGAPHHIIFDWSDQEEWDGRGVWGELWEEKVHTGLWWGNLRKRVP